MYNRIVFVCLLGRLVGFYAFFYSVQRILKYIKTACWWYKCSLHLKLTIENTCKSHVAQVIATEHAIICIPADLDENIKYG